MPSLKCDVLFWCTSRKQNCHWDLQWGFVLPTWTLSEESDVPPVKLGWHVSSFRACAVYFCVAIWHLLCQQEACVFFRTTDRQLFFLALQVSCRTFMAITTQHLETVLLRTKLVVSRRWILSWGSGSVPVFSQPV